MKSSSLTFASIIAAIAASLCCLGPTITVLVGVGTFGLASVFESAPPYLLAVAGALLVIAFYRTYRGTKAAEACSTGTCAVPQRGQKALLWIGFGILYCVCCVSLLLGVFMDSEAKRSKSIEFDDALTN
jgi:mercuric ion transport protein